MHVDWHQRVAGALDRADKFTDFRCVEEQLSRTSRIRLHVCRRRRQSTYVCSDEKHFTIADDHVCFFQLRATRTYGFDFPALECDTRLVSLLYEIVVEGF